MPRSVSSPGPSDRCAMGINQLVEKTLSPPRGPLCCSKLRNASPWNMNIHAPELNISMEFGTEPGCTLVPELECSRIVSMKLGCAGLSAWCIPGICDDAESAGDGEGVGCGCWCW